MDTATRELVRSQAKKELGLPSQILRTNDQPQGDRLMALTLDGQTDRLISRWAIAPGPSLPLVDRTLFRWRLIKLTSPKPSPRLD